MTEGNKKSSWWEAIADAFLKGPVEEQPYTGKSEIERTVRDMVVGEHGYTMPWAFCRCGNAFFIDPNMPVDPTEGGTSSITIRRVSDTEFVADLFGLHASITYVRISPAVPTTAFNVNLR